MRPSAKTNTRFAGDALIGEGAYGKVWEHSPGLVRKEIRVKDAGEERIKEELAAQILVAKAGIGPRVHSHEAAVNGDPGLQAIVMQDIRDNYDPVLKGNVLEHMDDWGREENRDNTYKRKMALRHEQQMGALALKGLDLMDRHTGNVVKNRMTGRPLQLDMGIAVHVEGADQVQALVGATQRGFNAAGLSDIGEIVSDTVYDYLEGGQVAEAMDFTKQAFSRLQKLKGPVAY